MAGLEPARLSAQEPKSCMSANSITSANTVKYYKLLSNVIRKLPHKRLCITFRLCTGIFIFLFGNSR